MTITRDVVGRGLYAAATMGRLRTAVRTLADIDLMPDELLTHLDDVVIRLQHEEGQDLDEMSATCLYAVYDPVTRMCSLASAGHVPPAVTLPTPTGNRTHSLQTHFVDAPIGPPLGLGGLPFETIQFELPEGSLLALFTDGLIQSTTRDLGIGMTQLLEVLGEAGHPLEEICDRLVRTLLPSRPADDVALLLVRTRALDASHVSTLELPSDPSAVAQARTYTTDQLAAWNLNDLAFSTELIISELVTNAIRYGQEPISLRLILQSTLTCEVADTASTAPHLRRARTFDEGGRGLFLVAQLAASWGTRYTREGKVIWAEQFSRARHRPEPPEAEKNDISPLGSPPNHRLKPPSLNGAQGKGEKGEWWSFVIAGGFDRGNTAPQVTPATQHVHPIPPMMPKSTWST